MADPQHVAGALGPILAPLRRDEPVRPGDVVSRDGRAPFFAVRVLDGEWCLAAPLAGGAPLALHHPDFTRQGAPAPGSLEQSEQSR